MQIDNHRHSELLYTFENIDELELDNQLIVDLIKRNSGYTYCSLCRKPYLTYNLKYHDNKKHMIYEYYRSTATAGTDICSKSLLST